MATSTKWRPCCGSCRSERLTEVDKPGDHYLRCEDCGARWDGSQLTPDEARERKPVRRAAVAAFAP